MQRYPSLQLISGKVQVNISRTVVRFLNTSTNDSLSSIPFPIRDIFLCFFFTYSLISFSDNRRRELNLPFLGHTQVSRSHSLKVLAPARAFYKIRFSFSFLFNILFHFYERKAREGALVCAHDTRTTFQHYKLLLIFASKWM